MKVYSETPEGIDRLDAVAPPSTSTFSADLSAILRTESDFAMAADKVNYFTDHGPPEKDYNPYKSGLIPDDMDEFWEEFQSDHNANQTALTVGRMRHLQQQRKIRDEAHWATGLLGYGIAGMASSTTIPFMLMPAGILFKGGVALKGAMSIGKTALQVGAMGAVEESLAEYIRHDFDPNRTMTESYGAVAAVSLFGGALGGLGAKMTNVSYARALKDIEELKFMDKAVNETGGLQRWIDRHNDSVGAQRVASEEAPDELGWIGSKWLGGGMFPGVRLFTSPAKSVRRAADKLINHAWGSKRSSAENNIRRTEMVARARTLIIGNDAYKAAIKTGYQGKQEQFWEEIGEALIVKDKHKNDHVAKAAQQLREEIIEPIKKRFQQLGDLPEEMETRFADSYFPRVYREEVLRESQKYTQRLKNHLLEKDSTLSDAEALSLADDYMKKIKGQDVSKLPQGIIGSTGRLKQRGIDLMDTDLQKLGFLEKNALIVMDKYINSVVPEMEIKIAFGGLERAARLKQLEKDFKQNAIDVKKEFEERLNDPKAVRELSREEIEMDFEDYMFFAKAEFKVEQEAIETIHKGRMEDARVEYDRIRNEVESDYRPIREQLKEKYEQSHAARRVKRDSEIEKAQKEFDDVEKILRRDFKNLNPTTELQKVKAQKKLEAKIRAARTERNATQKRLKAAAKKKGKEINEAYVKEKTQITERVEKELEPHTKKFEETNNQTGIKQRAEVRATRTAYENKKDKLRGERDRDYKAAQKEKVGGEQALRRQKRSTLKQQKRALKKLKKDEGGGAHLLTKELDEIDKEYDSLVAKAKTQKEEDKLERRRINDKDDISAMRDRLLGIYKRPASDAKHLSNIGKNLRAWSYLAYMGFMTFASLPDMARAIMKHGIAASYRGFRGGFPAFFKGLDAGSAIQRQALNDIGISVDALLSSRALMMGDIADLTGKSEFYTKAFTKLTLMNRWNDTMKHVAGITAQHRFLTQIKNYDSLSVKRKLQLKEHGFDEDMVDRIRTESDSFSTIKGALMANTDGWIDREAAEHFEKMLLRDVEIAIVTPGVGDSPLMMSAESAKLVFQFKSFFLASHTRAFLPMLRQMSRGDANAFIGFTIQMALGAFVVEPIRLLASGRGDEIDEMNWQDWAYAGADRSGVMTLALETLNLTDKLARGKIGELMGIRNSRYNQRGISISGGPGLGIAENFLKMPYDIGKTVFGGDWTERNTRNIRQLIPAQNLFYARWFVNMAEDAVNDMTDAKE